MRKRHDGRVLRWLVTAVLVLALSGCGANKPAENNQLPGDEFLPAFELADLSGQTVKVPDRFAGRALYLVFFSTG